MKRAFMTVGAVLIALGILVLAGTYIASGFDISKLSTGKQETNTHVIRETIENIEIGSKAADIALKPSADGTVTVVCVEWEKEKHAVSAENGTLKITASDQRKWYEHIGVFTPSQSVTVYLPENVYNALIIENDTGSISVPDAFSFESVNIKTDTGGVTCHASASGCVKIRTDTGNISVKGISAWELDLSASTGKIAVCSVTCDGAVSTSVSTGRTELTDVTCKSLISHGSTGAVTLKDVVAEESFTIERDTGDVRFDNSDAAQITVKTDTGDVTGTLRTEKVFITRTDTGAVSVPDTVTGGRCEIATDTGDIHIELSAVR